MWLYPLEPRALSRREKLQSDVQELERSRASSIPRLTSLPQPPQSPPERASERASERAGGGGEQPALTAPQAILGRRRCWHLQLGVPSAALPFLFSLLKPLEAWIGASSVSQCQQLS